MKTSRELANNLRILADWLDAKPEFPVPTTTVSIGYQAYYDAKNEFLAAVRALGTGTKGAGIFDSYLCFTAKSPDGTQVSIEVNREKVCKLIHPAIPAEYDCESLLSPEEHAEMESEEADAKK